MSSSLSLLLNEEDIMEVILTLRSMINTAALQMSPLWRHFIQCLGLHAVKHASIVLFGGSKFLFAAHMFSSNLNPAHHSMVHLMRKSREG